MQELAAVAIMSHPKKRASSSEIRDMLMRRYRYFDDNPKELGVRGLPQMPYELELILFV